MVVAPGGDGCGASDRWGLAELGTAGGAIDGVDGGGSVVIAGVVTVVGVVGNGEMTGGGRAAATAMPDSRLPVA